MAGCLYVVSTPIGNLGDMTPRAAETLRDAQFIAAEDTRVTLKLLNYLGIKKPLVSYNQHNAAERGGAILQRVAAGESCALCTDAGTPAISDPGELLVRDALGLGITVVPVPAASAAITALSVSGLPTGRFVFEGFVSQNKRLRASRLAELAKERRTMVFYEAPHKLPATLLQLSGAFGEGRAATVCRELTKLHEEIWPTTLGEAAARYAAETPRGEFVLVVAGAPEAEAAPEASLEEAVVLAAGLRAGGLPASEAARDAARQTGQPRRDIYRALQDSQG